MRISSVHIVLHYKRIEKNQKEIKNYDVTSVCFNYPIATESDVSKF